MLLAQAGFGPGDKLREGLRLGLVDGVIFSPKDERPDRVSSCVHELRRDYADSTLIFDPQFYVASMNAPRDGKLPDYRYYADHCGLNRTSFRPSQVQSYVQDCLDYQNDELAGLSYLVSPSVLFEDFRDSWSQIALNLAEASIECHATIEDAAPLLVTIATSENALKSATGLAELLDALSTMETEGFYIVVSRNSSTYQTAMDETAMANLMYMVHVLSTLNDYTVFAGYSDWLGLLLHAAGVTGTATGWFQSSRQFSMSKFQPASGGRRPRKRYSSAPMLSSLLITPELDDIFQAGLLDSVLTGGANDGLVSTGPSAGEFRWTDELSCYAHWAAVSRAHSMLNGIATVRPRLNRVINAIDAAAGLYNHAEASGVNFEPQSGPGHLEQWRYSINAFRSLIGV